MDMDELSSLLPVNPISSKLDADPSIDKDADAS
jgi:hypothetical protein